MSKTGLTPKREKFAQAVASGKTQADAYREAFDAKNMTAKTIREKASILMADGNVRATVNAMRQPAVEAAQITLESHLRDLLALRNLAAKEKQMSAAIAAEVARGKAAGVVSPEKREVSGPGGAAIHMAVDMSVMTDEQLRILATIRLGNAGV